MLDADFQPHSEMEELTAHFYNAPMLEWFANLVHSNRDYNRLTKALAIVLDGHFVIEHSGRHQKMLLQFQRNSRRMEASMYHRCRWVGVIPLQKIWTILPSPAQRMGFHIHSTITANAEIPSTMTGMVVQQFRWAREPPNGSSFTAALDKQPKHAHLEGTAHPANFGYWMTLLLSLVIPYTTSLRWNVHSWWSALDLGVFLSSLLPSSSFTNVHRVSSNSGTPCHSDTGKV